MNAHAEHGARDGPPGGRRERLFTALELPVPVRDALALLRPPGVPGVKPVAPAQLHVTLHFLGTASVAAAVDALAVVEAARFELTVAGLGFFSRRGRPQALWVGVAPCAGLGALHSAAGDALETAGFALEARPFRPHVTLARFGPKAPRDVLRAALAQREPGPLAFGVARFVLLASRQTDTGSVYEPRLVCTLD